MIDRRTLGRWVVAELLAVSGCNGRAPPPADPEPPPPPDRKVGPLTSLMTLAGLDWLLWMEPSRLWSIPWLKAPLSRILERRRLDLLKEATAIDLRRVTELALASYRDGASIAYLVRHPHEAIEVERRFRDRLTSDERRTVHGHQLVTVGGKIGTAVRAYASIGPSVAAYQYGGELRKGPVAVATLYARGALDEVPRALDDPTLTALHRAFEGAALQLLWPGPFEGELARGARGLLGASTGFGVAAEPAAEDTITLTAVIGGHFGDSDDDPIRFLELAWKDLVMSDLGHLLGLHTPRMPPKMVTTPLGLVLRVDLDAQLLLDGLADATVANVREMMDTQPRPPTEEPHSPEREESPARDAPGGRP